MALAAAIASLTVTAPRTASAEKPGGDVPIALDPHRLRAREAASATPADMARRGSRPAFAEGGTAPDGRPLYRNWRVWGGTGVGCALIGAGLLWVAREATDDLRDSRPDPSGAPSTERRLDRSQAGAVAAFSLAGVSLGAAAWLWFRERDEARTHEGASRRSAALAPMLGGGKLGLAVRIGF